MNYIRNLLKNMTADDDILDTEFAVIAILGAYIKRQTNLILLKEKTDRIPSEELNYCIRESVECLKTCNVSCSFHFDLAGEMDADMVMLLYDIFERAIEKSLDELFSVLINVYEKNQNVYLKIVIEDYRALLPEDYRKEDLIECDGTLRIEEIDGVEYVMLRLPKGGAKTC